MAELDNDVSDACEKRARLGMRYGEGGGEKGLIKGVRLP